MIISKNTLLKDNLNNEYVIEEQIGQGGFGYVYKARRKKDSIHFAIKTLPSDFVNQKDLLSLRNSLNCTT